MLLYLKRMVLSISSFLSGSVLLGELDLKIFHCVFLTPLCQITRYGEFVLPLDSFHKKPYEVLILGRVQGNIKEALRYARLVVIFFFEAARILLTCVSSVHNTIYCSQISFWHHLWLILNLKMASLALGRGSALVR